jgi:TolA-binding protein
VTRPGSTVATTAAPAAADPHTLNDEGYSAMKRGDYTTAIPLLQQAVQGLQDQGPSDPYEAYANFNLGYSLLEVGRCSEAVPYLERAKHLEPSRHEPKEALKQAKKC